MHHASSSLPITFNTAVMSARVHVTVSKSSNGDTSLHSERRAFCTFCLLEGVGWKTRGRGDEEGFTGSSWKEGGGTQEDNQAFTHIIKKKQDVLTTTLSRSLLKKCVANTLVVFGAKHFKVVPGGGVHEWTRTG